MCLSVNVIQLPHYYEFNCVPPVQRRDSFQPHSSHHKLASHSHTSYHSNSLRAFTSEHKTKHGIAMTRYVLTPGLRDPLYYYTHSIVTHTSQHHGCVSGRCCANIANLLTTLFALCAVLFRRLIEV